MAGFFEEDAKPAAEDPKGSFFEEDAATVAAPEGEKEDETSLKEIGRFVAGLVGGPAKEVLRVLSAPMVELDKVTGAPPRAAVGAMQRGEGIPAALQAAVEQAKAGLPSATGSGEILSTTPTGEEIALQGMTGKDGIHPAFAEKMAPFIGAGVEGALDLTQLIPSETVARGAGKVLGAADAAATGVVRGIQAGERAVARPLFQVGQVMTQGAINPQKAMKAAATLSARELLFPGTRDFGALAKANAELGEARAALQSNRIEVPGSHQAALDVVNFIQSQRARDLPNANAENLVNHIMERAFETKEITRPVIVPPEMIDQGIVMGEQQLIQAEQALMGIPPGAPEAQELTQHILKIRQDLSTIKERRLAGVPFTRTETKKVQVPRDMTLDEMDDLTGMFDRLMYTDKGYDRSLSRIWKPTIRKSRAALDKVMQTVPEGELFKGQKGRSEALLTAGKHRSKLMEAMSLVGFLGAGAITMDPTSLLMLLLRPRTYYQIMGTLKVPGDVVRTLTLARESGKAAVVRDALKAIAEKNPVLAERIIRSTVLVSGKPEAQQALSEEEANTLGAHREFDPEMVAMERARIESDHDMTSTEKARRLSQINRNGYFIVESAPTQVEYEKPTEEAVFGGKAGLETLMQDLKRSGG
jgi:hypothetical protein